MANNYPLGSVWKRRDERLAVIVSDPDGSGWIQVIEAGSADVSPYQVSAVTGKTGPVDTHAEADLIYRYDGFEIGELLDAAEAVVSTWERGDLAGAVRELETRAKIVREAA